jgi:hypothetical protein
MNRLLGSIILGLVLAALVGCVGSPAGAPVYGPRLIQRTDGLSPFFFVGKDLRRGRKAAVLAFNTLVYPDRMVKPAAEAPKVATAADLRDLTDAMLQSFVAELLQVDGVEVMSLAAIGGDPYYRRLPGTPGTELGDLPLDGTVARLLAPVPLRYLEIPGSQGEAGARDLRGGTSVGDWLSNWWTGHETVEAADFNLLCVKLQLDFVVLVNNRVVLTPDRERGWSPRLELIEVLVVGAGDLNSYAYARYVEGSFADPARAPATDPLKPEVWDLLRPVAAAGDATGDAAGAEAQATPAREFATNRYWPAIADPYRQLCGAFRQQLNSLRRE